jgi:hypothetical protein
MATSRLASLAVASVLTAFKPEAAQDKNARALFVLQSQGERKAIRPSLQNNVK